MHFKVQRGESSALVHEQSLIHVGENPEKAARIFVGICRDHPDADSSAIVRYMGKTNFQRDELEVLSRSLPALARHCQSAFTSCRELGLPSPEDRLVQDVNFVFIQHQKALTCLPEVRAFPGQMFEAVTTYLSSGNIEGRPTNELLRIRQGLQQTWQRIDSNLQHALLEQCCAALNESGIDASLLESRWKGVVIKLATPHTMEDVETVLSAKIGAEYSDTRWYYLQGNESVNRERSLNMQIDGIFLS